MYLFLGLFLLFITKIEFVWFEFQFIFGNIQIQNSIGNFTLWLEPKTKSAPIHQSNEFFRNRRQISNFYLIFIFSILSNLFFLLSIHRIHRFLFEMITKCFFFLTSNIPSITGSLHLLDTLHTFTSFQLSTHMINTRSRTHPNTNACGLNYISGIRLQCKCKCE